jgi:hypothetical protein
MTATRQSFMKTLKQEEGDGCRYRDAHQARNDIGAFIEEVYTPAIALGLGLSIACRVRSPAPGTNRSVTGPITRLPS